MKTKLEFMEINFEELEEIMQTTKRVPSWTKEDEEHLLQEQLKERERLMSLKKKPTAQ